MGLAASQARFLAITSRKANCEFQSMEIAQNKLSITRELAQVSEDYQNALNKTTLVWDYDGTGENTYNLSYGVLMTPTVLNNFNPYLVTTRTGSVVLNGQMANAARIISPDGAPVARSAGGFAEFMNALGENGVLPKSTAAVITDITNLHYVDSTGVQYINPSLEEIQDNGLKLTNTNPANKDIVYANGYNKNAGYGSEPLSKNGALANNIVGLSYRLNDVKLGDLLQMNDSGRINVAYGTAHLYKDGNEVLGEDLKKLSIGDILTNNVTFVVGWADNEDIPNDTDTTKLSIIENLFSEVVGTNGDFYKILGTDNVSKKALNAAAQQTKNDFFGEPFTIASEHHASEDNSFNTVKNNVSKYNDVVFFNSRGGKFNNTTGISLTNLFATYLTYFDLALNGYDSEYSVGPTVNTSNFVTDNPMYNYLMNDSNAVTSDTIMKADFYMQIYNNICINGWTQSSGDIEDNDYLEQMLKNGNYFITSLNEDGYFYQGRYNEGDCIIEVKDEDAIAQAEAEFTSKKARLTYKEEQLDLNMKNLDAEISSLTTEYDSVKQLISKNVEKVFTMFQ